MKRVGLLALIITLGLAAVVLLVSGLSTVSAETGIDLLIEAKAPTYVDTGATYVVNLSFANKGTADSPDNWIRATLPSGTQFVESTYIDGRPRPPDVIAGNVLTWTFNVLPVDWPWGHILIVLQTDEHLAEGTDLTFVADIATSAFEPDTTNNTTSATTSVNYMGGSVKQVQARHAMPGDVLTYTITIDLSQQAGGNSSGRWVTLTDTLPSSHQVRFLGWSSAVTGTLIDGHTLHWEGRVYAGAPLELQYQLGVEGAIAPGEVISNVAMLSWTGQQMQLGPVTMTVTIPHGVLGLGPNQGGQLAHRHGVTLTVPPGAVTDTTRFQFRPLFTDTQPSGPPGGLLFANRAFEVTAFRFGEPVGRFNAPLTITVGYTDTDIAGLKQETLRWWTRTGSEGIWSVLGEPARMTSRTMCFTTTHFSQFALFGEAKYKIYLPTVVK